LKVGSGDVLTILNDEAGNVGQVGKRIWADGAQATELVRRVEAIGSIQDAIRSDRHFLVDGVIFE